MIIKLVQMNVCAARIGCQLECIDIFTVNLFWHEERLPFDMRVLSAPYVCLRGCLWPSLSSTWTVF